MPRYIIERELPGAGKLSREDLRSISQKWYDTLLKSNPRVQWVQSFIMRDKITSIYIAPDAESVRAQSVLEGLPASSVLEITEIIDPITAEQHRT